MARLVEELDEIGLHWDGREPWHEPALLALDYARRPAVFEHRVPSYGAIVAPTTDESTWNAGSGLEIEVRRTTSSWMQTARLFADGLSSWALVPMDGDAGAVVFSRPAGSERDLVVLAEVMGATLIQRHPNGTVRVVGTEGVHRWDGMRWQHVPPLSSWIDSVVSACSATGGSPAIEGLLEFALHDLGARNIGATLIAGAVDDGGFEARLPAPPPLSILSPSNLAPLRHALAQIDGATVFDADGAMRQIGVRLVPTEQAEATVPALRGMRHTAARRYSHDVPMATVVVVSESGSVTVLRGGHVLGVSPRVEQPAGADQD